MAKAKKKEAIESEEVNKQKKASKELYIIGVGASAGGLQALSVLFSNVPNDSVSYVIVQHLSSEYRSFLKELLEPHSRLEIIEVQPNMLVEPNKVYIIPHNKELIISNNLLQLTDKGHQDRSKTIDTFFKSLAADKGHRAIGILLSGTGLDGTEGVVAIKKAGGMVIVQDPETAKFDGMLRNAINTGYADLILEPELMPQKIFNHVKVTPIASELTELVNSEYESTFYLIMDMIHERTGIDFSNYKRPTIIRRISRRMAVCDISSLADYLDHLNLHQDEVEILSKELLIGVTKFFRDEEAYKILERKVIPALVDTISRSEQLRVWVAGCSTGEEAYSIAILIREYLDKTQKELEVKIFASDIDRDALDFAGKGVYPPHSVSEVSEKRLNKYFVEEAGKYKVCPLVRRMVIFAPHNVTNDPPFSRINLVSCRNMLIYLNPLLQKKAIDKFHYTLRVGGYLFLDSSESIGDQTSFVEINKKWKIYRNIEPARSLGLDTFASNKLSKKDPVNNGLGVTQDLTSRQLMQQNFAELLNDTILEEYGYAAVYVDEHFDILHGTGRLKKYLDLPENNFTFNILKLVSQDLASSLGTLLRKAVREKKKVSAHGIQIRNGNIFRSINVVVSPSLTDKNLYQKFILVLLSEAQPQTELKVNYEELTSKEHYYEQRVQELELELQHTKENLQAVVEELETSNEELQSTNEELLSSNEKLQSTNAELQSLNEELHTINTEHQYKIKALMELNDDLNSYFRSTDIGQIFVDRKLIIRKYTPAASRLINLTESDIGRSIYQISNNLRYEQLIKDIKQVVIHNITVEKDVQDKNGVWYQVRILPYITQDRRIDGAIIIFIKINELKNLHIMQTGIMDSSPNAIIALKSVRDQSHHIVDFKISAVNKKTQELLGRSEAELLSKMLRKEWPALFKRGVFEHLIEVVETGETLEVEQFLKHKQGEHWKQIVAVKFEDGLVLTLHRITGHKQFEEELKRQKEEIRESADRFRTMLEAVPHITWVNNFNGENEYFNEAWYNYTGLTPEQSKGWGWTKAFHPEDLESKLPELKVSIFSGSVLTGEARILRESDKQYRWHLIKNIPVYNKNGKVTMWIGTATDVQDYKDAEEANIRLKVIQQREILKTILQTQETERTNISEALHNGLGQILYATKLNLDQLKPGNSHDQEIINKVNDFLKESIQVTRDISFELNPAILKDFGLKAALKEIVPRFNSPKLKISLRTEGFDKRLDSFVELSLYRIVQELINNVIKHSKATRASVELVCIDDVVTLTVEDNGTGFDKDELQNIKGTGLRSILHKVELLNGSMEIESGKDTGTMFRIICNLR